MKAETTQHKQTCTIRRIKGYSSGRTNMMPNVDIHKRIKSSGNGKRGLIIKVFFPHAKISLKDNCLEENTNNTLWCL